MKSVTIYIKGHADHKTRAGGWAAALTYGDVVKLISGGAQNVTHNAMELTAALEGLNALREPCDVFIYSNNKYVANVQLGDKNVELWKGVLEAQAKHPLVIFEHLRKEHNADYPAMLQADERAWDEMLEIQAQQELT